VNAICGKEAESTHKRRRAKKSLEERFKDYNGDYQFNEIDWGEPVRKEIIDFICPFVE